MKHILLAKQISKSYGDLKVLNQINLSVGEKEIVSIIGPSGAGKTTLLHILGTLDRPDKKSFSKLIFNGEDMMNLSDNNLAAFRNKNMGFIFQFHELLPEFTALENVCIPSWIGGTDSDYNKKKALALLNRLGLKDRALHKPGTLSGGEQQRVAVARALINDPKIIFADEPTGNLDSENADILHDLFFELREERDCSFVIVTHNKDLAQRSDRNINIVDGEISL